MLLYKLDTAMADLQHHGKLHSSETAGSAISQVQNDADIEATQNISAKKTLSCPMQRTANHPKLKRYYPWEMKDYQFSMPNGPRPSWKRRTGSLQPSVSSYMQREFRPVGRYPHWRHPDERSPHSLPSSLVHPTDTSSGSLSGSSYQTLNTENSYTDAGTTCCTSTAFPFSSSKSLATLPT